MAKNTHKHLTTQKKVAFLRLHHLEHVAISDRCNWHGIRPTVFYRWQTEFCENRRGVCRPFGDRGSNSLPEVGPAPSARCLRSSLYRQLAQRVAIRPETTAVNVHEDRIRNGYRPVLGVLRSHHRTETGLLADGRHDHMAVAAKPEWDLLIKLHRLIREPIWVGPTGEVVFDGRVTIEEYLDAVHVEPVRALDSHLQR